MKTKIAELEIEQLKSDGIVFNYILTKGDLTMKYLIILLLLSGCVARPIQYDIKKTIAEQHLDRLDNMERGLINEAKEYQR